MGEKNIKQSIEILENDLSTIRGVSTWAEECGYENPKNFYRHFIKRYQLPPKKAHLQIKMKRALHLLKEYPDKKCHFVAIEIGHSGQNSLNAFLNNQIRMSPRAYRSLNTHTRQQVYEEWKQKVDILKSRAKE
ncbi:MAG: helix-turn-helix domain-containing protein [Balneolaceae bacterium]|nr:helix-turn-helix domain-containing protein [Balneolaceae bacterium]